MLDVKPFKKINEVIDFIFKTENLKVIVPGPKEADELRSFAPQKFFLKNIDPVTMSSFVTSTLAKKEFKGKKRVSKSDLLRILGPIWTLYARR